MKEVSLTNQLISICILIVGIICITLGIILPKELLPIYEENIYNKLKQPLIFVNDEDDINKEDINSETDIAYIYIINESILTSYNIDNVIENYNNDILKYIKDKKGKFIYKNKLYYYYNNYIDNNEIKISITNDNYINNMRKNILQTILLITGISFTICSLILIVWSNNLVHNIILLKNKIDNIDNDKYKVNLNHNFKDEISSLNDSIEKMKRYLKNNENYKNQTYQNISHDFKTPITVIKSYIEATEDGIETNEKSLEIIKEQINKLENKVHSLLYLNKLNYIKDKTENKKSKTNISSIIKSSTDKFKLIRPDINFIVELDKNNTFKGTEEMWETIIDNILNNFMRYAKKEIKITVKNKRIILFNDGDKIDENILNSMFTPYEKGLNGMFGLGLSIVKKSLQLLDYDITVNNVKNGVNFIIK
jgi:two-component system sensor histidine kinase CssS